MGGSRAGTCSLCSLTVCRNDIHRLRGSAHQRRGRGGHWYKRPSSSNENGNGILSGLACWNKKSGQAETELRQAVQLSRMSRSGTVLGHAFYNQNKFAEAEAAFQKAAQLEPNNVAWHSSGGAARHNKMGFSPNSLRRPSSLSRTVSMARSWVMCFKT